MPETFEIEEIWSPNSSSRQLYPWIQPQVCLIHHTGDSHIEGTISWFKNPQSAVSADFVIGKDGYIARMVKKGRFAWHAGKCVWKGKVTGLYNVMSYGIELVNKGDGADPYPDSQLKAMAYVVSLIQKECPTVKYIRRHEDAAYPPGRKTDPKGLSISKIYWVIRNCQPEVVLK